MEQYFIDSNRLNDRIKTILSPSGNYQLTIEIYKTGDGYWNYSRGLIYKMKTNELIFDIKRNYSHFHYTFITYQNKEYLITGRSYMKPNLFSLDEKIEIQ